MTRDIIEINEELCNGCGDCVVGCAEGAIQLIDGKARLVREEFCDGFGDCVGVCPTGALTVVKRVAPQFDEQATIRNLLATEGIEGVRRYHEAQRRHAATEAVAGLSDRVRVEIPVMQAADEGGVRVGAPGAGAQGAGAQGTSGHGHHGGGCPGSMQRELRQGASPAGMAAPRGVAGAAGAGMAAGAASAGTGSPTSVLIRSELAQWPVQLHLVQPGAPFFRNREMLVMNTCGPIASAEVHQRYLRDRSVVVACPKLDNTAPYAAKLAAIFEEASIPKVVVVIMEVPCCRGLAMLVRQAREMCSRDDLVIEEHVLTLEGAIKSVTVV